MRAATNNRNLFVATIVLNSNRMIADQLRGVLRGQWVLINGMMARIVNVTNTNVALWMHRDAMVAVFR